MKKISKVLILAGILLLMNITVVYAHGVDLKYQAKTGYEILATYDDGSPMSEAQVIIYAPEDPKNPWLKASCDEEGRYYFIPDFEQSGNWTVQFRKAGHGGTLNIPIGEGNDVNAASSGGTGYSPLQVAIMIIAVAWGFVGTALYFKREK